MSIPDPRRGGDHLVFVESNLTGTGMQAILIARSLGLRCIFVTARLSRYTGQPRGGQGDPAERRTGAQL